jgi:hypothetical protein
MEASAHDCQGKLFIQICYNKSPSSFDYCTLAQTLQRKLLPALRSLFAAAEHRRGGPELVLKPMSIFW